MRIIAAQIIGSDAGHPHGDTGLTVEFFQFHGAGAFLITDHQLRNSHVRIGKLPQAQTGRSLHQPGSDIDFTRTCSGFQLREIGKMTPAELDFEGIGQPFHQLDVNPGQALQTAIVLGIRHLQDQTDPQLAMVGQPLLLLRRHQTLRRPVWLPSGPRPGSPKHQ